jgi:ribosomal protein L7/L12
MSEPSRPGTLDEIRRVIAGQAKMFAIKLYRDKTGAGHAEAKEAVERIGAGRLMAQPPAAPAVGAGARAAGEALRAGNEVEAVRLYRAATGVGLKEAKDAIDAIMAERRAGPRHSAAVRRAAGPVVGRRRLNPILALLILAVAFGSIFGLVMLLFSTG